MEGVFFDGRTGHAGVGVHWRGVNRVREENSGAGAVG